MAEVSKLQHALNLLWRERYGYPFDDWVDDRRNRGASWRQIAKELDDLVGISVTNPTLIGWFSDDREPAA